MNLLFKKIDEIDHFGGRCAVHRAVIGTNPGFWFRWRNTENKEELQKYIVITKEKGEWVLYRFIPLENQPAPKFELSYYIKNKSRLLPYQPDVVSYLCSAILRHGAAADGSDTGIGKTYTALAVARELEFTPGIICRKPGIAGWKRACLYMNVKPLFIVNWEHAKMQKFTFTTRERDEWSGNYSYKWILPENTLLVFDEAHMANHDLSQNNSLYIASRGQASLSLSATFADRIVRLRALFYVLGIMTGAEFTDFIRNRGFVKFKGEYESLDEQEDLKYVNKYIYPSHGYRLSYSMPEIKKYFPDVRFLVDIVTLPKINEKRQNKLYMEMLNKVAGYHDKGRQADALVADLRYRQAAELLKADVLIDTACGHLYEGKSVCIFVCFRETLSYLSQKMKTQSLIYGNQKNREKIIDDFQTNKTHLIICMSDAGGQSINLHDLDGRYPRVSLICPSYTAITLHQVCGRTYRAGSKSVPIIKLVYAGGTVEEKVANTVLLKIDNISALNDGDLIEPDLSGIGFKR